MSKIKRHRGIDWLSALELYRVMLTPMDKRK